MEQTQPQTSARSGKPVLPPLPTWPTSKPGPKVTQPPAGTRRVSIRSEQVVELQYDAEQGKSSVRGAGK